MKQKLVRKVPLKRIKKPKVKTLTKLKLEVQKYFNLFIRPRDISCGSFVCISCSNIFPADKCQAGHFFGTKMYNHMRYLETNVHSECAGCNCFNHDSLIMYTLNIQNKISKEEFDSLIQISKEEHKEFTRNELNILLLKYKKITLKNS